MSRMERKPRPETIKPYENLCLFVNKLLKHWDIGAMEFMDFVFYYRHASRERHQHGLYEHREKADSAINFIDELIFDIGETCMGHVPKNPITPLRVQQARSHIKELSEIEIRNPMLPHY